MQPNQPPPRLPVEVRIESTEQCDLRGMLDVILWEIGQRARRPCYPHYFAYLFVGGADDIKHGVFHMRVHEYMIELIHTHIYRHFGNQDVRFTITANGTVVARQ